MTPAQTIITAAVALLLLVIGVSGLILSAPLGEEVERWREDKEDS